MAGLSLCVGSLDLRHDDNFLRLSGLLLRVKFQMFCYRGLHVSDRCHYLPSLGTSQPMWKKHRLLSGGFFSSPGLLLLLLSSLHAGKLGCFMLCKA